MNVLAKPKRFFPGLVKGDNGKVRRHRFFQAFLDCWDRLLASTTEQAYNDWLEEIWQEYPA
jgi:hypothetical protein